jgi:hypothetical protein
MGTSRATSADNRHAFARTQSRRVWRWRWSNAKDVLDQRGHRVVRVGSAETVQGRGCELLRRHHDRWGQDRRKT